ncbi:MAG: hypothetical protein JSW08_01370 [archaeon]|nr:MAG: hypothetical protein JSW08_01370 [archaeon]
MKLTFMVLIMVLILASVFVLGASCGQVEEQTAGDLALELNQDLNGFNTLESEINEFSLSELDDLELELEEIETLT